MNKNILTPLTLTELQSIFDETSIKVIEYLILKSILGMPEDHPLNNKKRVFSIPEESFALWAQHALNASLVSSGNNSCDIILENNFMADIKSVVCKIDKFGFFKNSDSNESSLAQNFADLGGSNLDILISQKKYDKIVNLWLNLYKKKISGAFNKNKNCPNFYYFWFIKTSGFIGIVGFKINIEENHAPITSEITESSKSVILNNFVDSKFGQVKIYSSKKRMEMRLKPKNLEDKMIKIQIPKIENTENLRNTLKDISPQKAIENFINKIKN